MFSGFCGCYCVGDFVIDFDSTTLVIEQGRPTFAVSVPDMKGISETAGCGLDPNPIHSSI